MKKAIIYYEKVWSHRKPMIKVLDWKNVLTKSELPKEYFKRGPYFYYDDFLDLLEIRDKDGGMALYLGIPISVNDWERAIRKMKRAGERLHNILKKKKWQGKGKVII